MRVLILSCNTGEGHNACGRAIQECFRAHGVHCDMDDAFRFISKGASQVMSDGFVRIYRHCPELFEFGYNYTEKHPGMLSEDSGLYKMLAMGADRLFRYIYSGAYDSVVCTHIFAALMLNNIKRRYPSFSVHTSFFPTDYTCYPGTEHCGMDTYFIPAAALVPDFVSRGIPASKLDPSGIPIRMEFYQRMPREKARKKMNLPVNCHHLMVMCGSMGCGPIRRIAQMIRSELPADCIVSIICGTNRQLYKKLAKTFYTDDRFRIYQYVDDISTMMDSADLFLTKPGGISVTEASHKRLPMVFVNAVEGCESYNKRFFTSRGIAVTADSLPELAHQTVSLLCDDAALAKMTQAQAEYFPTNATEHVVQSLMAAYHPVASHPKEAFVHEPAQAMC